MTMPVTTIEGWGWPGLSRKAHYFVNSISLCCHWAYTGPLEQGKDNSPDNCAACRKKLEKRNKP